MSYQEVVFDRWTLWGSGWECSYDAQADITVARSSASAVAVSVTGWMRTTAGDTSLGDWICWIRINNGTWQSFSVASAGTHGTGWYSAGWSTYITVGGSASTATIDVQFEIGGYAGYTGRYSALKTVTMGYDAWAYTISFNANGGTGAPAAVVKTHGVDLILPTTVPTRTGHSFIGWAATSSGTAQWGQGGTYTVEGDATLYAKWQANTYTISFNANGGSGAPAAVTKTYGVNLILPSTVPTRTGYTFIGWAATSSGTAKWGQGGTYTVEGNATLYAKWSANPYTISFNANGGSGAPSSVTKYHNTTLTLPTTKPTRSGYSFLGWSASSSATTATWSAGGSYTDNVARTLYAVWKSNTTYTVTYNANGGSSTIDPQSGYSGTSITLWTKAQATPIKANTTATVTLTFDKVEADATISKSSASVTKTTSYTFSKWNTKANGSGTSYSPGQTITLTGNLTLYAQYTSKTSGSTSLPTGTLDQHVLQGWSKSTEDISILASPYSPTQSETLYAIWAVNGLGGMLKLPGSLSVSAGTKIRLVGTKGNVNDGVYTVASKSTSGGVTTIYFNEDFPESITQDASSLNLEIYGAGTYVPPFDFICAKDNRLWGCSSATRTIYASALGIPDDFEQFEGTADDSYQLVVATPGDWTGCVALNSGIIFTKQHYIHKMLGGFPAEYALYTYNADGTSETNGGSLINVNGTAMYVGEHGVMRIFPIVVAHAMCYLQFHF